MVSSFVRLGPPELAEMIRRANSYLTPEGAQNWYANDVPKLIMEVATLRIERDRVYDFIGASYSEEIPVEQELDKWISERAGLYEKQQYRKLKAQVSAAEAANMALETQHQTLHGQIQTLEDEKRTLVDAMEGLRLTQVATESLADEEKKSLLERLAALDEVIRTLRQELQHERVNSERLVREAQEQLAQFKVWVHGIADQLKAL